MSSLSNFLIAGYNDCALHPQKQVYIGPTDFKLGICNLKSDKCVSMCFFVAYGKVSRLSLFQGYSDNLVFLLIDLLSTRFELA